MLYEERIMRELCAEMGIEWIDEPGSMMVEGKEVTGEQFVDFDSKVNQSSVAEMNIRIADSIDVFNCKFSTKFDMLFISAEAA